MQDHYSILQIYKDCKNKFHWQSQPIIENIPVGNIFLSASVLFAGTLPSKVLRVLSICGMKTMSLSTYFRHQKNILLGTVSNVWHNEETKIIASLKKKHLVVKEETIAWDILQNMVVTV